MVKGISRQVIVVHSPDPKLFEQAIFILRDEAMNGEGITNDALLKEADRLIRDGGGKKRQLRYYGPVWAFGGAALTAAAWIISALVW